MKNENGMVTSTRSQHIMVRIHPQMPIPVSLSLAAFQTNKQTNNNENKKNDG